VASEIRRIRPDIIFTHQPVDLHPDHVAAHNLGCPVDVYAPFGDEAEGYDQWV
jgi:LmbE family N-acetylglucosaminyl deacetylase